MTKWIVAIAWMYIAVMMAMAEATHSQGTVLGAIVTFVFYGVAPLALVMYLINTPARRRARRAAEARASASTPEDEPSAQADAGSLPSGDPVSPERKVP